MSAEKRWRLICYDVRCPKRYRRVHKICRGRGHPVQYSIFRAHLDDRGTEQLRKELARVMAPEDRLLIVDLCPACAGHVVSRNHVDGWTVAEPSFLIVGESTGSRERQSPDHGSEPGSDQDDPTSS